MRVTEEKLVESQIASKPPERPSEFAKAKSNWSFGQSLEHTSGSKILIVVSCIIAISTDSLITNFLMELR